MKNKVHKLTLAFAIICFFLTSCGNAFEEAETPTAEIGDTLILYNWIDYMPQSVMDDFTAEYGIRIEYVFYESQEEAVENIKAGKDYDLVVLPPELIGELIQGGYLAGIDYRNVLNFKNISANFRDLSFDPGNEHSVPFHWGTTGLLYRTDLVQREIDSWRDLWDPEFAGRVGLWPIQRTIIPIALKSLGFPANSEDPVQIEKAGVKIMELRANSFLVSNENSSIIPTLMEGKAVIGYGWAYDAMIIDDEPIKYVIPKEGSFLWSDHFVIPANSKNKRAAELFIDFVLRPEVSGRIINESYYPMANVAAEPYVDPVILNNPIIYPLDDIIAISDIIVSINPERLILYEKIWKEFMDAGPTP